MHTCEARVWDNGDMTSCDKTASYWVGKHLCEKCGKIKVRDNFDYSIKYLESILLRLHDTDFGLINGQDGAMMNLKDTIQHAINVSNEIRWKI